MTTLGKLVTSLVPVSCRFLAAWRLTGRVSVAWNSKLQTVYRGNEECVRCGCKTRRVSAGLDVLAGLAETALSEENKDWDLADPPPLDLGSHSRRGPPPASQSYSQRPKAQPHTQTHGHAQLYAQSHAQSYAARDGQGNLHKAPAQGHYEPQGPAAVNGSALRQLPGQLHAQSAADSSHFPRSSQQDGQELLLSRHQGRDQQTGQFLMAPQPGFHAQPQPGHFQGLPQHQGQQSGQLQAEGKQQSHQSAQPYQPQPQSFSQGCSQPPRPGLFQSGQLQGHPQGPDQHAAAQARRHMQQQSMGSPSSDGIIRPQAVRSQGWTMHRGHQQGPAGQLQALPPVLGASLGATHPQSLLVGQSHPYHFGTGPPGVFQGQNGPHTVPTAQRASQSTLPVLPSLVLPSAGQGQLAVAPISTGMPQAAVGPPPQFHDQTAAHQGHSMAQHGQKLPHHGPNVSQYGGPQQSQSMPQHGQSMPQHSRGMPQHGQSMPQHGQSMPELAHSQPQQGHSMPQHNHSMTHQGQSLPQHSHSMPQHEHSMTQPEQEPSQHRQVMSQPAASEIQTQPDEGAQTQHHPSLESVPKVQSQMLRLARPCRSKHVHHVIAVAS